MMHTDTTTELDPLAVPTVRARRQSRPWLQLLNAVLTLAGTRAELVRHSETPWASVTFCGTRHIVVLHFEGIEGILAADDFVEALPEHEFALPGRLVADATVIAFAQTGGSEPQATIEAEFLLLDDRADQ